MSHILIVEDEHGIAELLRFTLNDAGFVPAIVYNAEDARRSVARILPQAILLDWMLPDAPGLSLVREWRNAPRTADLPVIMLTAKGTEEDKVKGLNAGADDYITKPFSPRELIARIQALLRRKVPELGQGAQTIGVVMLDGERNQVSVSGRHVELDQAEFKLLRFLMAHPARPFSRAQLLDKVWGDHAFIEERTIDVHIMRLRKSLGAAADYVKTVRGVGYMFAPEAES
jgi:two-component system phosphate regulon response regulator PhoB